MRLIRGEEVSDDMLEAAGMSRETENDLRALSNIKTGASGFFSSKRKDLQKKYGVYEKETLFANIVFWFTGKDKEIMDELENRIKDNEPTNAEVLMTLASHYDDIVSFVVGQRAKLEEAGFSPTASEKMAMEMWRAIHLQMGAQTGD